MEFNFNAMGGLWEMEQSTVVEGVGSRVEILSLPHTSCVALDNLLNLSVEFSFQFLHLQMEIIILPT